MNSYATLSKNGKSGLSERLVTASLYIAIGSIQKNYLKLGHPMARKKLNTGLTQVTRGRDGDGVFLYEDVKDSQYRFIKLPEC